jgi:hypothetical protein
VREGVPPGGSRHRG